MRLNRFVLVAAFVGMCLPPALGESGAPAKSYQIESDVYKKCCQSDSLISSQSYSQAKDVLLSAAASDPTSYSAHVHAALSSAYRGLKDYPQALSEAQRALSFDSGSSDAMYATALTYYDLNQFDEAMKWLQRFLESTHDEVWKGKARTLVTEISVFKNLKAAAQSIEDGKDSEAKRLLEKAAANDPSRFSAEIHSDLAYVLRRMGNPEKAIAEAEKSLKFDSTARNTMYTMGIAYQDLGRFNEAIGWLQKYAALETDPERQRKAKEFIQELSDDRVKLNDSVNKRPDYLDQLRAEGQVKKWPREQLPIKVYIAPGKSGDGYRPQFRGFIVRALDTWCLASGKKLSYKLVDDPQSADVRVKFTRDELPMEESNRVRQKAGLTWLETTGDGKQLAGKVKIRTVCAFDPSKQVQDGQCASVCVHEVGHALGLGHSTCYSDIMYFGSSSKQTGLPSGRDKATIRRLYEDYRVVAFVAQKLSVADDTLDKVQFQPPPMFVPPKPVDTDKLAPPLFLPPPIKSDAQKLQPPIFIPPPIKSTSQPSQKHEAAPPLFVPPPLSTKEKKSKQLAPPVFVPPPK